MAQAPPSQAAGACAESLTRFAAESNLEARDLAPATSLPRPQPSRKLGSAGFSCGLSHIWKIDRALQKCDQAACGHQRNFHVPPLSRDCECATRSRTSYLITDIYNVQSLALDTQPSRHSANHTAGLVRHAACWVQYEYRAWKLGPGLQTDLDITSRVIVPALALQALLWISACLETHGQSVTPSFTARAFPDNLKPHGHHPPASDHCRVGATARGSQDHGEPQHDHSVPR